jgi:ABC-2 type transport system ATP-binding protein
MGQTSSAIELRNVTKTFGSIVANKNICLDIRYGEVLALLGENGSGKTTLIKTLTGLLQPSEGAVYINGQKPGPETKARVSYLPERTYLSPAKSVSEVIEFFADFYEDFRTERAKEMLNSLGIDEKAKIKTLSKGTREKVQLILVMSRDADLFILDEPIAGVDPAARDYIIKTIITNYNETIS